MEYLFSTWRSSISQSGRLSNRSLGAFIGLARSLFAHQFASQPLSENRSGIRSRRPEYCTYDQLADHYEKMHDRWLRHAGGEAQAALEAALLTRLWPGMQLLDAGCGNGALTRTIQAQVGSAIAVTMLDVSPRMLAQANDIEAERVNGSLLQLPFASNTFDLAVACWSIEASGDPLRAISELARVVRPGGNVLVAFCANEPAHRPTGALLRKAIEIRRTGHFLEAEKIEHAFRIAGASRIVWHRCRGPVAVLDVELNAL